YAGGAITPAVWSGVLDPLPAPQNQSKRHATCDGLCESTMKTPRLVRLLRQAASEAVNDGVPFMGAAISFYSMISIAPLFVIAISVAGLVFGAEAAEGEVYRQLRDLVGAEGAAAVEEMVRRSREPGTGIVATLIGT